MEEAEAGTVRFFKAVLLQAIKSNNQVWFSGKINSPINYTQAQAILTWLPQDGLKTYAKRLQIKQILNHTLTQNELYIISQSDNITETAKILNKSYHTIRAAKLKLKEIL